MKIKKHLKYLLLFLFLLALVVVALPFLAAPWVCHIGGDVVCFGGAVEVTGSVWGPCNYTGAVEIIDGPPIDWQYSGGFVCVAAGRAGGKTYAVFIRVVEADAPTGDPFKSEIERDLCYCAKERIVPCIFAKTAVSLMRVGIFVVDVEEGVGHLFIGYWVAPYDLNYSRFIFGGDGVYLVDGLAAEIGAKREIMGPLLKGCAYRVKIKLEPEKLTISHPLYNVTTRALRVG